jgi:hypothetical protein
MMKQIIISLMLIYASLLAAEDELALVEKTGEVLYRSELENTWKPAVFGLELRENDALQTKMNSSAKIEINHQRIFQLPAQALVEAKELKFYSTSELVLILTSLEISNLPPQNNRPKPPSGAYVIHGNQIANRQADVEFPAKPYVEYEMNGLKALIKQEFWAGVLLKGLKLKKYPELVDMEYLDFQIVRAYHKLNLTRRFQLARDAFLKVYSQSSYVGQIQDLR